MPRAVVGHQLGPPETYRLEERDPGPPGPGQVRVSIRAAGVSYVDVLTAMGRYQVKPPLPYIPGSESAGVIEALGEGVDDFAVGDRVFCMGMGGVFAEAAVVPAMAVTRMPDALAFDAGSVLLVNYLTARLALAVRGQARPGETLLVLGAAGGTGAAAVQVGKQLGLRVIASASSAAKRDAARTLGADAVVETGTSDWREQVRDAADGSKPDLVFDPVGGEATEPAFRSLGYGGRHLVIGFPAGIAKLPTNLPLLKGASLVGVGLREHAIHRPTESEENRRAVLALAEAGRLQPLIAERHPIERYAEAMRSAFSGTPAGRVVLLLGEAIEA